jgi:uroporphyrinogen-III synthase
MPQIVLCKTASSNEDGVDAYREAFETVGFQVQYIPVLQEDFRLDELRAVLQDRNGRWAGVVITSKRGAEAWIQAVATFDQTSTNGGHFIGECIALPRG